MSKRFALLFVAAIALPSTACKKGDATAKAADQAGCGSDYSDPNKQFCIKVPPGYAIKPPKQDGAAVITIMEAAMSGIEVVVTTDKFDEQEPFYDKIMHGSSRKIIETGGTPGSTRWWVFTDSGSKNIVEALAKSATGTTISCSSNNTVIPAEVIEACKTLRPYPAGAAKK